MKYHIQSSPLSGTLLIPPSKSHTMRAILFGLFGEGKTTLYNSLHSPDTMAMLKAIQLLGAQVKTFPDRIEIIGKGPRISPAEDIIHAGNSGQVLRFIGAIAGLLSSYTVITGDHSIRHNRPVKPLLNALKELNVFAESMRGDGYAPILIKGPIKGGGTTLEGQDSQPVSGMLIAACFSPTPTEIFVKNPGEKPWIDLTLHWLDFLGIHYENHQYVHYKIQGGAHYSGFHYTVPSDFSSLAFPMAAALVTRSSVTLENIDMSDVQGDKKLIETLVNMGAKITIDQNSLQVAAGSTLQGAELDINDYIDSITILAVLGCYAEGETQISNAAIARKKECDRIHAIVTELKKMGADIEEKEEGLIVRRSKLKGAHLKSYHDHRMALSLTVAALGAHGASTIDGVECVNKTYPTFARDMQKLGAQIKEEL